MFSSAGRLEPEDGVRISEIDDENDEDNDEVIAPVEVVGICLESCTPKCTLFTECLKTNCMQCEGEFKFIGL